MANGAFYSIRRVPTKGLIYGKSTATYMAKIDSLLFENIPGKILETDTIMLSGYQTLEIKNKTRLGDLQRYRIIYTPLEIIICRVGGHKTFVESAQPRAFFDNLKLTPQKIAEGTYTPNFGGFNVWLPAGYRAQYYAPDLDKTQNFFEVEAIDENQNYFAVNHHQFYDYDYIEEDNFELEYIVDKLVEDEKLTLDTLYFITEKRHPTLAFQLKNKDEAPIFGQLRIVGPNYFLMLTTAEDANLQAKFFGSLAANQFVYGAPFSVKKDTTLNYSINTPVRINGYHGFLYNLVNSGRYGDREDTRFKGEFRSKKLVAQSGEEIYFVRETLNKFESFESTDEFWKDYDKRNKSLIVKKIDRISEQKDSNYLAQTREVWYTDTNSTRAIRIKYILQNQALYSLSATVDTLGYTSPFVDSAFASFSVGTDSLFGTSILEPKSKLFFSQLQSRDSVDVFEAVESVYSVTFKKDDFDPLAELFANYQHKGFNRETRLDLLGRMARINPERAMLYLSDLYKRYPDSSAYQFAILDALAGIRTKESTKLFATLILDETPFGKDSWQYTSLFYDFRDSVELMPYLLPDILELTDFEEYRDAIYSMVSTGVYAGVIKKSHINKKYSSILRFAKVELKKQKASDQAKNKASINSTLNRDTRILNLFAKKAEVQKFYADELTITNKRILADIMQRVYGHVAIPDTLWNYAAKEEKERVALYEFLLEKDALDVLKPEYKTQEALAEGMIRARVYSEIDSMSLLRTEAVDIKGGPATAYFFKARYKDADFDRLLYVVIKDNADSLETDYLLYKSGEEFNLAYDDIDEMLRDAKLEIKVTDRARVVGRYRDYYNYEMMD